MSNSKERSFVVPESETLVECEAATLKTCPQCGAKMFDDMDICYGCLYDFSREESETEELWGSLDEIWENAETVPQSAQSQNYSQQQVKPCSNPRHVRTAASEQMSKPAGESEQIRLKVGDSLELEACGLTINICASHA